MTTIKTTTTTGSDPRNESQGPAAQAKQEVETEMREWLLLHVLLLLVTASFRPPNRCPSEDFYQCVSGHILHLVFWIAVSKWFFVVAVVVVAVVVVLIRMKIIAWKLLSNVHELREWPRWVESCEQFNKESSSHSMVNRSINFRIITMTFLFYFFICELNTGFWSDQSSNAIKD